MMVLRLSLVVLVIAACGDDRTAPVQEDAPAQIDAADACAACDASQLCVQSFNGTCGLIATTCVARTELCPGNACSAACQTAYCAAPLQCANRAPCGPEASAAFTCYGP